MTQYIFVMKNDPALMGNYGLYTTGVIQGLIYGLCAIPCNTTLWDCERFNEFTWFPVECTEHHCKKCMEVIERGWPGQCHYEKVKRA